MSDFEFYSCPRLSDVKQQYNPDLFIETDCEAGCGKRIIYHPNCDKAKPKVCYVCSEWVANTAGNA